MATTDYALGWKSYFGIVPQAAFGTPLAATKFQTINSTTLKRNKPQQGIVNGIRKMRQSAISYQIGQENVSGNVNAPLMPDEAFQGQIWASLLGLNNTVSGTAGTGYTHTFLEGTQQSHFQKTGYTVELLKGGEDVTLLHDYETCFVKSITITGAKDGIITMDVEFIGETATLGGTLATPTYPAGDLKFPFQGYMATLKLGATVGAAAAIPQVQNWSLKIDNGAKLMYGTGSRFPIGVAYERLTYDLSFTMDLLEASAIENYFNTPALVGGVIDIQHTVLAGSSTGVYGLTFNLYEMIATAGEPDITGDAALQHTMNFSGMYSSVSSKTLDIVALNSESGTYS